MLSFSVLLSHLERELSLNRAKPANFQVTDITAVTNETAYMYLAIPICIFKGGLRKKSKRPRSCWGV